ncbi:MAG TPA: hypothetical protein VMT19_09615 [Thermoanaerobaculaceae bacterium]|nr:hypothetical protein [Thermoanaerobaculaceae bacterium]
MNRRHRWVVGPFVAVAAVFGAPCLLGQPQPAPRPAAAVPTPALSDAVLEITPPVLDRLAKALAAENEARKAAATPTPAAGSVPPKTREEYAECQQALTKSPEYLQLVQAYGGTTSGKPKDPAARQAAEELMAKLAALTEKSCGPDPARTRERQELAAKLRDAEARAATAGGFTVRQYAVLKERVTPLCLSDPEPPTAAGRRIKGTGAASFVYSAKEAAALQPRCDAFVKLLYPDQD